MGDEQPSIWFFGDLGDPWVAEIADALPVRPQCHAIDGDWPTGIEHARVVVVHRAILSAADGEAFRALKAQPRAPKLLLCVGPHVRASDLDRWATCADVLLNEVTAAETIARHVSSWRKPMRRRPIVAVTGGTFESRRVLLDTCASAGYPASAFLEWSEVPDSMQAIWEVPVLEPDWERSLEIQCARRPVVCLMGFADRDLVARARRAGALACLDLPFEPADLAFVLDSLTIDHEMRDSAHEVPPPPMSRRAPSRSLVDRRSES